MKYNHTVGKSATGIKKVTEDKFGRYIVTPDGEEIDIRNLVTTHTALIIRQSIAQLDKTIRKPKSTRGMSAKWYETRNNLGKELWKKIEEKIPETERKKALEIWQWKLHPYAKNIDPVEDIKILKEKENNKRKSDICGRWYDVFANDINIDKFDPETVAGRIYKHLFEEELRIDGKPRSTGSKTYGLIKHRANSIKKSVHEAGHFPHQAYGETIFGIYGACDLAEAIFDKADKLENNKPRPRRLTMKMVGELMFQHYADIGLADDKSGLSGEDAEALQKLHREVRTFYKRIVRGSARGPDRDKADLSTRLPCSHDALMFRLVQSRNNAEINTLIREGKIIYYANSNKELFGNKIDTAAAHYRTSQGQAEIQRAESFMRIWRTVKDQAARTVKSWADPDGVRYQPDAKDDILYNSMITSAVGEQYDDAAFSAKAPLLFGAASEKWLKGDEQLRKDLLEASLKLTSRIRTDLVHFVSRTRFANGIKDSDIHRGISDETQKAITDLYIQDQKNLYKRVDKDLKGALVHRFISKEKYSELVNLLAVLDVPEIPLPRFNRVLGRWQGVAKILFSKESRETSKDLRLKLPIRATAEQLEKDKAARARFTTLKAAYETRFGTWLEGQIEETVRGWVNATLADSTKLAFAPNQKSVYADLIEAKAHKIPQSVRGSFSKTFDALSSLIATEIRDQNAYEANPQKAKENSKWVEDFKLDLMTRAFAAYLDEQDLMYLTEIDGEPRDASEIEAPTIPKNKIDKKEWEANLYYFLHLVPPADISQLLHQFKKMAVLEKKGGTLGETEHGAGAQSDITNFQKVLKLRLAMHNDKFTGTEGEAADAEFAKTFYEKGEDFAKLFPETDDGSAQAGLKRGLRELVRFGHLKRLQTIFEGQKIKSANVDEVLQLETPQNNHEQSYIAFWSKKRQNLHDELVTAKKPSRSKLKTYSDLVQKIGNHRRLSADVRLGTHLSVHHLMMRVYSRLTGFAADWERDRLFVFLGLLMRRKKLASGNTIHAYGDLHNDLSAKELKALNFFKSENPKSILADDWPLFSKHFGCGKPKIRNDFAHYNTLALDKPDINLTKEMNRMRRLMAYDRKRKNSVSKSIRELLEREGFKPTWKVENHNLVLKNMGTIPIHHLGKEKIPEHRHSLLYTDMVQALFESEDATKKRKQQKKAPRK